MFFGPTCNLKCRKMISTIHLPQLWLILAKFEILEFFAIISKNFESYLLSKMALFSKPKSLRYQMFQEVFQHLLNQNLVESSNPESPISDSSGSMIFSTFFGSHILHFSTVIWTRCEKVLNYFNFQRFSSHFTHKTILDSLSIQLYGVNVRPSRPMWR